jgi:hypothetical protein
MERTLPVRSRLWAASETRQTPPGEDNQQQSPWWAMARPYSEERSKGDGSRHRLAARPSSPTECDQLLYVEAAKDIRLVQEGAVELDAGVLRRPGELPQRRPGSGGQVTAVTVYQTPQAVAPGGVLPGNEQFPIAVVDGGRAGERPGGFIPGLPRLPLPAGEFFYIKRGLVGEEQG